MLLPGISLFLTLLKVVMFPLKDGALDKKLSKDYE